MSNDRPPSLTRLWHATLLIFGIVVLLWWALQILAQVWSWLLLGAVIVGLVVALATWLRSRRSRW
jgi:hypothetical protein